jgi:hypothetical protein
MSSINDKLGIRRGGKREMMKLPGDPALRARLTSTRCPACGERHARLSHVQPGAFWCAWCAHTWMPDDDRE